jgi:hypothetical protein
MRVFDITVLRDGGTTMFRIEKDGKATDVRLNTPFAGVASKAPDQFQLGTLWRPGNSAIAV